MTRFLFAIFFLSIAALPTPCFGEPLEDDIWSKSESPTETGVAVVLRGLNNNLTVMQELVDTLNTNGIHVLRATLAGHAPEDNFRTRASKEAWLQDVGAALKSAHAEYPELPLYIVGYSLGALTTIAYLDRDPHHKIAGALYIAPAIALAPLGKPAYLARALQYLRLSVPSFTPKKYRAHRWTPMTAYAALTDLITDITKLKNPQYLNNIPTTIALAKNDRLVSYQSSRQWLKANHLKNWETLLLTPKNSPQNHLLTLTPHLTPLSQKSLHEKVPGTFPEQNPKHGRLH